ncbi:hypothetical protein GCM10012286_34460 [Streptomyces lasiicapitis]|uniref:Uncharacterized protein n=1 Tax=Streptomyces lasiicapitis TaxID=1923961 RepID=A0ABQ2M115_9ACTN|nr:hypothetical protein GCM10012286_34460 [Streptomyces lasiicapitis]
MGLITDSEPITLRPATSELRPVIEQLAQLYRHDMSEFLGHLPAADGRFGFGSLPRFFDEPVRQAMLIQHGTTPGGFILTRLMPEGEASICVPAGPGEPAGRPLDLPRRDRAGRAAGQPSVLRAPASTADWSRPKVIRPLLRHQELP